MELRPLRLTDEAVFFNSLPLWAGEDLSWFSFIYANDPQVSFADMCARIEADARGENLPPGWVPATMLYAFHDGKIIGRFHIRHHLNEAIRQRGGNVGYAVAPGYRRQGVAGWMMQRGLEYIKSQLGLEKVLITCADSNAGSYRVIENAGGVLENKVFDDGHGEMIRRYWINLR